MTDVNTTTEGLAPPPSNFEYQLEEARKQITNLQGQLVDARMELRHKRTVLESVQADLQSGLIEVLTEEDEDRAEWLKDFLDAHTPWEFELTRQWRVKLTVEVVIKAASEEDVRNAINDVEVNADRDSEAEVDGWNIDSIDED